MHSSMANTKIDKRYYAFLRRHSPRFRVIKVKKHRLHHSQLSVSWIILNSIDIVQHKFALDVTISELLKFTRFYSKILNKEEQISNVARRYQHKNAHLCTQIHSQTYTQSKNKHTCTKTLACCYNFHGGEI